MDHVTVKSRGSFRVSNHRDKSCRDGLKHSRHNSQVGNKPVCVGETGKSAASADKSTGTSYHGFVADVTALTGKSAKWNLGLLGVQ